MFWKTFRQVLRKKRKPKILTLAPRGKPGGRVLFSYLDEPLLWRDGDPRFGGHPNKWRSAEIAKIFQRLGFIVDAISWDDREFIPSQNYDVVFDIHANLARLSDYYSPRTLKLLHLTGSYGPYQNKAELKRIKDIEKRKGILLAPQRRVSQLDLYEKSLQIADYCFLVGNKHTLSTFSKKYYKKIHLLNTIASYPVFHKSKGQLVPPEKEFLWFFGGGAPHKGLDLVLEVFSKHPELNLNVVGNVEAEEDFFAAYRQELTSMPNIKYHGYLSPSSHEFEEIARRCFCFIAPSCSEGMSTAVVTALQVGLFPVISKNTGVDLPKGLGVYLESLSGKEVEKAVLRVAGTLNEDLEKSIRVLQKLAKVEYSREKVSKDLELYVIEALEGTI